MALIDLTISGVLILFGLICILLAFKVIEIQWIIRSKDLSLIQQIILLVIGIFILILGLYLSGIGEAFLHPSEFCGNGACGNGENCGNCLADCECPINQRCKDNVCVVAPDFKITHLHGVEVTDSSGTIDNPITVISENRAISVKSQGAEPDWNISVWVYAEGDREYKQTGRVHISSNGDWWFDNCILQTPGHKYKIWADAEDEKGNTITTINQLWSIRTTYSEPITTTGETEYECPIGQEYIDGKCVIVIDDIESTFGWTPHISEGSSMDITIVSWKTGKGLEIAYDLKEKGYVVISKEVDDLNDPEVLSKIKGIRFFYKGSGKPNTIELKLVYGDDSGTTFGILWNKKTVADDWVPIEVSYSQFSCWWPEDSCLRYGNELDTNRVKKIEFAVSNKLYGGDEYGSGTLIIDDVQGIVS